ncbi:type IV secretory system conjugative DNA transfer family protein [Rhizobium wenxiniae]|uniref:type IV secretory system conjugative DNA transfer family protein n=1 Tax=Rhizobium wenxiniae TaxID=1737357 RepID=UPI003C27FBE6
MTMFKTISTTALVAVLLCACTTTEKQDEPPPPLLIGGTDKLAGAPPLSYEQFARSSRNVTGASLVDQGRFSALRDAALAYASQAGYERRQWEIFKDLEIKGADLSRQYNFNDVVYVAPKQAGYVVPPVVSRAKEAITITRGGTESVAADEYYRIELPGRLVSIVPTWRDYLIMGVDKTSAPEDHFLPANKEERKIWDRYMAEGWGQGRQLADATLKENMNLLQRDYQGMIEYRRLVDAGMINSMVVRSSEVRARGTVDELFIGQRRVKIENSATFNTNSGRWKPVTRRFSVVKP